MIPSCRFYYPRNKMTYCSIQGSCLSIIRLVAPDNVDLSNKDCTSDDHRHGNDRKMHARKIKLSDWPVLFVEDCSPHDAGQ